MQFNKWNYEKHAYDKVDLPDDFNCKTYSDNMEELLTCPHCGKNFKCGEGYTSMEFHAGFGFGCIVCGECYQSEIERRKKYRCN